MGCGCGKSKANKVQPKSKRIKKSAAIKKQKALNDQKANTKQAQKKIKSVATEKKEIKKSPKNRPTVVGKGAVTRCPLCNSPLKRVANPSRGELVQCTNPNCGYVRGR